MTSADGTNEKLEILTEVLDGIGVFETEAFGVVVDEGVGVTDGNCVVGLGELVSILFVAVGLIVGVPLEPLLKTR